MLQKIHGYHLDQDSHWVAELECGHGTRVDRESSPHSEFNCKLCDKAGLAVATAVVAEIKKAVAESYEDAGLSGLCDEGRMEVALGALESLPLDQIIEKSLKASHR